MANPDHSYTFLLRATQGTQGKKILARPVTRESSRCWWYMQAYTPYWHRRHSPTSIWLPSEVEFGAVGLTPTAALTYTTR